MSRHEIGLVQYRTAIANALVGQMMSDGAASEHPSDIALFSAQLSICVLIEKLYTFPIKYHTGEKMSAAKQIRDIVATAEPGEIFIPTDFQDISSLENVHNVLSRLEQAKELRRCARGVYCKPRYSSLLKEEVPPSIDAIARAIARTNGWTIIPSGNHALNMLGIDTQVPASFSYVSSGPYKEYDINGTKIRFKHRANRDILEKSRITCLFIQALKELGKERVDRSVIDRLANRLSNEEAETLYEEARNATSWVFEAAKAIKEAKGL